MSAQTLEWRLVSITMVLFFCRGSSGPCAAARRLQVLLLLEERVGQRRRTREGGAQGRQGLTPHFDDGIGAGQRPEQRKRTLAGIPGPSLVGCPSVW